MKLTRILASVARKASYIFKCIVFLFESVTQSRDTIIDRAKIARKDSPCNCDILTTTLTAPLFQHGTRPFFKRHVTWYLTSCNSTVGSKWNAHRPCYINPEWYWMFRETALHKKRTQLDQYNDVKQADVLAYFISPLGPVSEDTAELQVWGTRANRKVSS